MVDEFKRFLFRGNVIDLAVAVIIGAAFTAIVTALVTGVITPLVGMIVATDVSDMHFTLRDSIFKYGLVLDAIIRFMSVAGVVFFIIVKPMQAIAARRASGEEEPVDDTPAPSDEALLLTEIRDLLAQRTP